MYITNEELENFIKIEHLIMSESNLKMFKDLKNKGYCYFNNEIINNEDISKYWNIIEKLIKQRDKKNKINSKKIAEKRKENKFYARSKNEIEKSLLANAKRIKKEGK